jgi:molecular chaperone GrpE
MKKQEELTKDQKVEKQAETRSIPEDDQQSREVDSNEGTAQAPAGDSTEEAPEFETPIEAPPEEEDRIATLENQLDEQRDRLARLAAEFDNYKKRTTRDFSNLIKSANEQLIADLLEVLDNFDRAFASKEQGADFDAYDKGMKLVHTRLLDTLSRAGLKKFESVGQKFDPNLHEALMQIENDELEPDTVAQEFQPGYNLNDKVLRHAKVGVVKCTDE